jgi:hypothetical protein
MSTPQTIAFPRLELIRRDHAPPIVIGTGEVRMASPSTFTFTLTGKPPDSSYAFREIRNMQENPYDALARFRLVGVDTDGIEWSGGYTVPNFNPGETDWTFHGSIDGLSADIRDAASPNASTEVIFCVPPGSNMALAIGRFVLANTVGSKPSREHAIEVLGSTIRFDYVPSSDAFSITASPSAELPLTYAENWLGEPLRIMFGQLIFPRLVARNFGDGRSLIWIRPAPDFMRGAGWAALWRSGDPEQNKDAFWSCYCQLLRFIARSCDEAGNKNFEANNITRLYEEVIQATRGSRWVWALTFASSVEALVKMLIPKDVKATTEETKTIDSLVKHIKVGPGDDRLRGIAINAVHRSAEITTIRALRELLAADVITKNQLSAWQRIRNSVMHGNLVSPYSSEEADEQLIALADLMHVLTRELLNRSEFEPG